jgi:hypothetical protein
MLLANSHLQVDLDMVSKANRATEAIQTYQRCALGAYQIVCLRGERSHKAYFLGLAYRPDSVWLDAGSNAKAGYRGSTAGQTIKQCTVHIYSDSPVHHFCQKHSLSIGNQDALLFYTSQQNDIFKFR